MGSMSVVLLLSSMSSALSIGVVLAMMAVRVLRSLRRRRDARLRGDVEVLLYRALGLGVTPRAARRLGPRHVDVLSRSLVEMLASVRGAHRQRLVKLAADVGLVERDLRALRSRRYGTRARAADNLGFYGGAHHVEALAALLEDPEEAVRAVAARALSRIGSAEAAQALAAHLTSASELTSMRMAENLERIGGRAVPALIPLLSSGQSVDRRGQALAARVLGNLRLSEARAALCAAVVRRWNAELRAQATLALGRIGHPADLPILLQAADDGNWPVRAQAAAALGMVGDVSTIAVLSRLLHDEQWWVRENAGQALANMGPLGEAALAEVAGGHDEDARTHAAGALGAPAHLSAPAGLGGF